MQDTRSDMQHADAMRTAVGPIGERPAWPGADAAPRSGQSTSRGGGAVSNTYAGSFATAG